MLFSYMLYCIQLISLPTTTLYPSSPSNQSPFCFHVLYVYICMHVFKSRLHVWNKTIFVVFFCPIISSCSPTPPSLSSFPFHMIILSFKLKLLSFVFVICKKAHQEHRSMLMRVRGQFCGASPLLLLLHGFWGPSTVIRLVWHTLTRWATSSAHATFIKYSRYVT